MISIESIEVDGVIIDIEMQCGLYLSISEYVNKISNNFSVLLLSQIPEYENFIKSFIQMVITMWQLTAKSIESKNLSQFETYSQYNAECFEYNINSLSHFLIYEVYLSIYIIFNFFFFILLEFSSRSKYSEYCKISLYNYLSVNDHH